MWRKTTDIAHVRSGRTRTPYVLAKSFESRRVQDLALVGDSKRCNFAPITGPIIGRRGSAMIIKLGGEKKIEIDSWELSKIISLITTVSMAFVEASKNKNQKKL